MNFRQTAACAFVGIGIAALSGTAAVNTILAVQVNDSNETLRGHTSRKQTILCPFSAKAYPDTVASGLILTAGVRSHAEFIEIMATYVPSEEPKTPKGPHTSGGGRAYSPYTDV